MKENSIDVLLIEDDPMVLEINRAFIEKVSGFKVTGMAANGAEGLKKIKKLQPDLVVLDIYMPKQDGIHTIHEIRKQKSKVDVIVISAANDRQTIQTMLQQGAVDYIIKPFKFERIQQALERYKEYRLQLNTQGEMSQKEVDALLSVATISERKQEEIPKGLSQNTLMQIIGFLKDQSGGKSSEEVAEGVGIARVTARRYLEYLEKTGEIKLDVQYGGVGRPINRYLMKNR
ncbi:response regulator [Fictibacillus enclensis]|uniref:Transcriptional regulatory protein n=1 Tax=Fictibacillus enclensis TaxID=1017270 RepID=A0A0V8JEJ4_9BACL|nr:response regulator [Fictibacillus enclensis]KSU85320.1 two-component system response regulator [Fictibacillus enclensis]MDM5199162.1 response regulator [Fictibacillus enclensis]SCB94894.1 two-component system, CitB family, response regulator DctR [Fictibacillus enclensis]